MKKTKEKKKPTTKKEVIKAYTFNFSYKKLKVVLQVNGVFYYSYHHDGLIYAGSFYIFVLDKGFWLRTFEIAIISWQHFYYKLVTFIKSLNIPVQLKKINDVLSNIYYHINDFTRNRFDIDFHRKKSNIHPTVQRAVIYSLLFALVVLFTYKSFTPVDIDDALSEINGIGGFGDVNKNDKNLHQVSNKLLHQLQEDEARKDALLGVKSNNEIKEESFQKISYKVQPGDTLSQISKKYNISIDSIISSTGITKHRVLKVGQTLSIPPKEGFYYKVKRNDRLFTIAQSHKVAFKSVIEANPNINLNLLEPNTEVFLPGAKPIVIVSAWFAPVSSRIITSGFGWRTWPRKAFHKGLDLKAFYAPVVAAKTGEVIYAGWLGGYGKAIVLSHENGYKTLYAHLSTIYVKIGTKIPQGRLIAKSGDTGYSFGPHLHFEVSYQGMNVNPAKFLKGLRYQR